MARRPRFIFVMVVLGWLLATAGGCSSMHTQKKKVEKEGPKTVEGFVGLPRVQP